jgi:hypothetical protein
VDDRASILGRGREFSSSPPRPDGSTEPSMQWVSGILSRGAGRVKRPGREADHSPPSSAEVKNACGGIPPPQYVFMALCLVKHRDTLFLKWSHMVLATYVCTF